MAWQPWKCLNFLFLGAYELLCSEKKSAKGIFFDGLLKMESRF